MPDSFMEKIYQGVLDTEVFHSLRPAVDSEKISRLAKSFREILQDYPSSQIEQQGRIPEEMLAKMGEVGLFGISIPKAYGGLEFNLWEYLQSVEEMARMDIAVAMVSLAHLSIGVKGIMLFGTESQKRKYLAAAASGEMIFSYALTEPQVGSDAQHILTRAELSQDGSHYVLNGQKTYITNANYAGGLTVFAQMDPQHPGAMGAFIVETGWEGVKIGRDMPKMGLKASSTAAIQFKDVRVPVGNLIGSPGDGFKIAMTILNYGRLGLGAGSVGLMKQSLQDMIKRSSSRVQFGVPIKDFQLVQEKIVNTRVHCTMTQAMNDFTALLLERNPIANVAVESSHCKLFGTTRAWNTLYEALQVAGGAGYLSTQPYEKRMRDFRVATVFEGTTEIHSIYPSLFAFRKLARQLGELKMNKPAQLVFILKNVAKRIQWPLKFEDGTMRRALRLARANVYSIRRMLYLGMLLYGKKVFEKEFLLRRITMLSLYTYGLLVFLAALSASRQTGTSDRRDLDILGYLVEEAREVRKANTSLLETRKESFHQRVFQGLFRGHRPEDNG